MIARPPDQDIQHLGFVRRLIDACVPALVAAEILLSLNGRRLRINHSASVPQLTLIAEEGALPNGVIDDGRRRAVMGDGVASTREHSAATVTVPQPQSG